MMRSTERCVRVRPAIPHAIHSSIFSSRDGGTFEIRRRVRGVGWIFKEDILTHDFQVSEVV